MLQYVLLLFAIGALFFQMIPLGVAGNLEASESSCVLQDIDSRLSVVSDILQTTRQKLPNDIKNLCKKVFCEKANIDSCEFWKCPGEEKKLSHTTCACKIKCRNCDEHKNSFIKYTTHPRDCSDIFLSGTKEDGAYDIWPQNRILNGSVRVYCDMQDGGGWTVIQRRGDFGYPEDSFFQDWNTYKIGFGDILKEFWIGNDNLFALTNQRHYEIKFELTDWNGLFKYTSYDEFWIDDEAHKYTLHVAGNYNGTVGDSFTNNNGLPFSTHDSDTDGKYCAMTIRGGWWYNKCGNCNLNGPYLKTMEIAWIGIYWYHFSTPIGSAHYPLKDTVMKIRPVGF